ncbi:aldo/keto reductase [Gleimia sp. 6138-11-ORH1]|uniref:aldo/keto reductase n=1 Tax=Gleimia sp. 6138-11-ORH1 TaxID=2973937 RepID=UPI002167E32F|nr:aldo/keto reductase [Gleimia sp. 6138-11-ORH1]MCS4484837.1 aldo/keto reductase [Gleimia sp. 6138-11-ORH1]
MNIPHLLLNTKATIPQFGLGTYKLEADSTAEIVTKAAHLGYRHFDTAQMYKNEAEVAAGIRASGIPREEFFVTSKLLPANNQPDKARRSFSESLERMQFDYVDLFLIHWPMPHLADADFCVTWRVLEEFYAQGLAKAIGVSNFLKHHLQRLLAETEVIPAVNQIESHPHLQLPDLHEFCAQQGILIEAWSPLARGRVFSEPVLLKIAQLLGKTPAQVTLRWALQRGDIVFPKTASPERLAENLDIFDFELSPEQMEAISGLDRGEAGRIGPHPDRMA